MSEEETKRTSQTEVTPRIYVASLADYNAGRLHGCWIHATQPAEDIQAEINAMLAESKDFLAEEWAIHDYEGFGSLRLSESEDLENVADVARLILEHGPLFAELVAYFGNAMSVEEARRYMEEGYQGEYDSLTDYAEQFVEDCYAEVLKPLPPFIRSNIDFEAIGRDMEIGGDVFTIECDGRVHVFWSSL